MATDLTEVYFYLEGQMPGGKNAVRVDPRSGRHYPTKRFKAWRENACLQLRRWKVRRDQPIEPPCRMDVTYVPGDARIRDVTGMQDALFHLFEYWGIVKDDSQIIEVHWEPVESAIAGTRVRLRTRSPVRPANLLARIHRRQQGSRSR